MNEAQPMKRPLTEGQKRLLHRMPELKDSVFPHVYDTLPADNYINPERFRLEKEAVFHSEPVVAAPSALLETPKSYAKVDIAGVPVLLTRTADGQCRAFVNACTHRGTKLCTKDDAVNGVRISCPYHAWTFALDGRLIGVPRQEIFPGLEKDRLGLKELQCFEGGGIIWVGLSYDNDIDFGSVKGELSEDLAALGLGDMIVYKKATFDVKANWKLLMDSMLDSYHVTRLHKDSVGKFFVDNENVIDRIGPHIRNASARGNFEKSRVTDDFEEVRRIMVFSYTPFPNGILVVSPDFVSFGVVRPVASDHTFVDYYMLANKGEPSTEKMEDKLRRSFELMELTFGQEDYWAAEQCDAGLRSGALDKIHLGGMEIQITMYQDEIDRRVKDYVSKS